LSSLLSRLACFPPRPRRTPTAPRSKASQLTLAPSKRPRRAALSQRGRLQRLRTAIISTAGLCGPGTDRRRPIGTASSSDRARSSWGAEDAHDDSTPSQGVGLHRDRPRDRLDHRLCGSVRSRRRHYAAGDGANQHGRPRSGAGSPARASTGTCAGSGPGPTACAIGAPRPRSLSSYGTRNTTELRGSREPGDAPSCSASEESQARFETKAPSAARRQDDARLSQWTQC
jgi:hypothetical protein